VNCRSFGLEKPPQEVLERSTSAAAEALLFKHFEGKTLKERTLKARTFKVRARRFAVHSKLA
jgi:hypothetical protein